MKTTIAIPDDLFADAEEPARKLKKSRSRLYGDAAHEHVARRSAESITDALDHVRDEVDCRSSFTGAAACRTLEHSDWGSPRATPSTAAASPPQPASR